MSESDFTPAQLDALWERAKEHAKQRANNEGLIGEKRDAALFRYAFAEYRQHVGHTS